MAPDTLLTICLYFFQFEFCFLNTDIEKIHSSYNILVVNFASNCVKDNIFGYLYVFTLNDSQYQACGYIVSKFWLETKILQHLPWFQKLFRARALWFLLKNALNKWHLNPLNWQVKISCKTFLFGQNVLYLTNLTTISQYEFLTFVDLQLSPGQSKNLWILSWFNLHVFLERAHLAFLTT